MSKLIHHTYNWTQQISNLSGKYLIKKQLLKMFIFFKINEIPTTIRIEYVDDISYP